MLIPKSQVLPNMNILKPNMLSRMGFGFLFNAGGNVPLDDEQTASIVQRCNASIRHGKTRRPGHRPHGSRLEHYRAMRRAECEIGWIGNKYERRHMGAVR